MNKTFRMYIENIKEHFISANISYEMLKQKEEIDRAHRRIEMLNFALANVEYDTKKLKERCTSLETKTNSLDRRFKDDRQFVEDVQFAMAATFPDTFSNTKMKINMPEDNKLIEGSTVKDER